MLNRQLSGMNRRTNQISLNSPSPLSQPASATPSESEPIASTSSAPAPLTSTSTSTSTPNPTSDDPPTPSSSSSAKRKLRSKDALGTPKRPKPSASAGIAQDRQPPATRLADLGGVDKCIESMLELVALPLTHPEVYLHTGVRPPRGVLLVGPPGCGKTMLAGAIAGVSGPTRRWDGRQSAGTVKLTVACFVVCRSSECHSFRCLRRRLCRECRESLRRRFARRLRRQP